MPPAPRGVRISYGPRRVPAASVMERCASLLRRRLGGARLRQAQPLQDGLESRVPAQAIPERIDAQIGHQARPVGESLLDPFEGAVVLAESGVDERAVECRDVAPSALERIEAV